MKVLKSHEEEGVNELLSDSLNGKSILFIDKSTSYVDIENYLKIHLLERSGEQST